MFIRKIKKQNKLKRILLNLLNVYAYEKETLNIVNPDYKNINGNFIDLNNKSFNFSRGYLNLTRKVKKLDIYYRYSPNNNLWNSKGTWKRIVKNINKETLITVCLISLKESILQFLNENKLEITINLIADNSHDNFDNLILNILKSSKYNVKKFNNKIDGNRGSYLECCDHAEKAEDLIFFVEDDYLFEKNCIEEMIYSFTRISSIFNKDVMMCPSDYPFYYDALYETTLLVGKNHRWRKISETLLTIMFTKEIFVNNKQEIRNVGEKVNKPFEKPLHDLYKKVNCLAPVNSLCHHISRSVPTISENWQETWNSNFQEYQKIIS